MINELRYAATFPTNGISLTGHHCFQPGATAISGRNGTGKSFIAEMVRYGMFGKRALRGPASDYKSLDMELGFLDYRVARGKKETLTDPSGEVIAVGADAVNKKIADILGFELEVFDVVCAANQKESERLTRLTPAKRKELIDDVVGLTAQEGVEKACREEAKGLAREAAALSQTLIAPAEPVKPEGYRPSADIQVELNAAQIRNERRAALQRVIDAVGTEPAEPAKSTSDVATLEAHEQDRVETEARYKVLYSNIARIPDAVYTREQLEAAAEVLAYNNEVKRRGPLPSLGFTEENLTVLLGMWAKHHALEEIGDLEVCCPTCQTEFQPGHTSNPPVTDENTLREELSRVRAWAEPLELPKGSVLTQQEIVEGMRALDRADEKKAMQAELDALPKLEDRSTELAQARRVEREWDVYEHSYEHWRERFDAATEAKTELDKLPEPKVPIGELSTAYAAARVYEDQLVRYERDKAKFDKLAAEIGEKQERADAFTAGAKGLVEARRTLKAFLAPSLSRVASSIVAQMTANAERRLYEVIVDDEMNITVDGQDVSTFNGAHATMINLALRLALGQVLVSRVMPLFIGDEIDSDLDEANAQALADAILELRDQLKQVVVISHKRLENFDHEITLS